ncbi:MAG: WecB/TagA/CpsF family glycosyltransferase [Rhizobiaceae bacterium]
MTIRVAAKALEPVSFRSILGVEVAELGWDEAIALLQDRLRAKRFTRVGFLNAHIANVACTDERLRAALTGFLVFPDGIGVDIAAKILYSKPFPANLNGTDLVPRLIMATRDPLKVGLIGATRQNADRAAAALAKMAPQHSFRVVSDGFFSTADEPAILSQLAQYRPDILLVALGVPKQELFISRVITAEHATMPFAVGALLDFLSDAVPRAPLWVRRLRMEWLFRMANEPGRLWRRYVLGNPAFLGRVMRQKMGGTGSSA